jgi:hypothetical protein
MRDSFRCPDGKTTKSFKRYRREWNKIIKPFEKEFNVKCYAFDPQISFTENITPYKNSIQIPTYLVEKINNRIKELKENPYQWSVKDI